MYHAAQFCYSDILSALQGFDDWLNRLGVPVRHTDRAHHALRVLKKAQQAFLDRTNKADGVSKSDYLFGLTEALELHDVYCAFRDHPPQQLRDRLIRALSGPVLPEAETATNRDGRNVMFELALGAEWRLGGGDVDLIEPDLILRMPNRSYLVACKRPGYERSIKAAVRNAASQIRSALSATSVDHFGIIAICLSRVLNKGNCYFSGRYEQLSKHLNDLMAEHRQSWRATAFHPRNIAVLFYAHMPADWGEGLYRLSATRIGPTLQDEEAHRNLRDDLSTLYSEKDGAANAAPLHG
ncbi:MAG TPA: hypothetical protein VGG14_14130 [Candidatus Sulfotelmatobacter sp.]|jgi:hypothetical protein